MHVIDRKGLKAYAAVASRLMYRHHDPEYFHQFLIVDLAYPHEVMRHVILSNYGPGTEAEPHKPLTGTVEVAAVVTSEPVYEVHKLADPLLQKEGFFFYSQWNPPADWMPEAVLDHMLVQPDPDPSEPTADPAFGVITDVVANLATRFHAEMDSGHHIAAIHTRRELEALRGRLGTFAADLDGRLEAIESLLLKGLSL